MKAIITVGVSASGKTTWAKEYAQKHKAIISNRDDLRFSLTGAKDWSQYKFDSRFEERITEIQKLTFETAWKLKKDFILSDTNLDKRRREEWVEMFKNYGYDVEIKPFPVTLEEAWKRDAIRPNGVGKDVIYKQWKQWLKFIGRKIYEPDENLPKAVIFDIDGTLAHMTARTAYQWDKVGEDIQDPIIGGILRSYWSQGVNVIIVSGRDGSCYHSTDEWLFCNTLPYNRFLMREAGDMRKDTVIKEEIFWRDIAPYYNVQAVFDDRPSVCRMWRELGLKVIQVGDPYEEF